MRQINDFERLILGRIKTYYDRGITPNLASVIDPQLTNKDIFLDFVNNNVEIRADYNLYTQGTLIDEIKQLTLEIVVTVNLLRDLQSFGYISIFQEAPTPQNIRYGQLVVGNNYITSTMHDENIKKLLLDYSLKSIIVGQPLITFINNNFKTNDEINTERVNLQTAHDSAVNKRNLKIAVIALIISTVLSFWEIYNGTMEVKYGKMQVEQEQAVKLNDAQLKTLLKNSNKIIVKTIKTDSIENVITKHKKVNTETLEIPKKCKRIIIEF